MRLRIALAFGVLMVVAVAYPVAAAPDNSPVWVEEPFSLDIEFPNPCLGPDFLEIWTFEGTFYFHEFTKLRRLFSRAKKRIALTGLIYDLV